MRVLGQLSVAAKSVPLQKSDSHQGQRFSRLPVKLLKPAFHYLEWDGSLSFMTTIARLNQSSRIYMGMEGLSQVD